MSPEQLLGELAADGGIVVFDMEAGAGTLLRMQPGVADVVLVVAEPSAKSIEVAHRLVEIASSRARVIVLANKLRGPDESRILHDAFGADELVEIPHDDAIDRADRQGRAPIDVEPDAPGVAALRALAERLTVSQL